MIGPDHDFGAAARSLWLLDPAIAYLNHGTVGAPPRAVLQHQRELVDEIERHPARFLLRELADTTGRGAPTRIRAALAQIAEFVGVSADDLVFVDNVTTAANAVLRSFPFEHGDEIVVTSQGYGGVVNAAEYAARAAGASVREIRLPRPGAAPAEFVEAVEYGLSASTRLLVIDHITSPTALILPVADIALMCHARGVLVFADGAHVPGQIPLDIDALGVDWYAANLHKWAWAPRSCGVLWTSAARQHHLRPTVTSWGHDHGPAAEFDLPGTRDPSALLTAPFAIDLLRQFGVTRVMAHNHRLAWWAGHELAHRWGTTFDTPEPMVGSMVAVPLPERLGNTATDAERVRAALERADVEAPVIMTPDGLDVRVSIQIYCTDGDIDRLGRAISELAPR